MEKTRVPKGEEYGYVDECGYLTTDYDEGRPLDDIRYEVGNYFNLKDEVDYQRAESMAKRFQAVLNGADAIEMPSEEEIKERLDMIIPHGPVESWCVEGYCKHILDWLKSKIVK